MKQVRKYPQEPSALDFSQIKPLDLAKARKKEEPRKRSKKFIPGGDSDDEGENWPSNEKDTEFLACVNELVGGPEDSYDGVVLEKIGERLERWTTRNRAIQYCNDNCRGSKPYRIPSSERYSGTITSGLIFFSGHK